MPLAISSSMVANLVALTSINDAVSTTQNRLNSGLAVASASDNMAVYFKAKSYNQKADDYNVVNSGITQAIANMDLVDKALENMQSDLKNIKQVVSDAKAKAVTVVKAAIVQGDMSYANVAAAGAAPALKGKIVQDAAGALASRDNAAFFQIGDAFGVTMTDASTGAKTTKYFRAADPATALGLSGDGSNTGLANQGTNLTGTTPNGGGALLFNDLQSLSDQMQRAFGLDNIKMTLTPDNAAAPTNYKLGFALQNTNLSASFFQALDAAVGPAGNTDAGAMFNFEGLFGRQQDAAATTYGTRPTAVGDSITYATGLTGTATPPTGTAYGATVYGAVGGSAAGSDIALQSRLDASILFKQTLYGLANTMKDAYLPGYSNILRGEQMKVNMNDTGDVSQIVQLSKPVDPLNLGFGGYSDSNGNISTTVTGKNFNNDADMATALTQIDAAAKTLRSTQALLAAAKTAMSSRLDFNKSLQTTLASGASSMTAADTTLEAANLATLTNRQSFATNNMAITKQAEQSLIQLLR
ncbi:hypothetical protein NK718_02215 [Alsobacter sp. SYSU M60028]|uniref:Flagellin N-terminal domain-containing protein n=1 Tax=Alsobacter ponti TaxID=2962936 RepID=A0ABT1L8H2_9HYPH|nr:hypothetical protein [Alsobacter ponti]MCP8937318.1 hypothetical protein [Alsobacter ponti]